MWCKILENVKLLALFSIKVCYANKMREINCKAFGGLQVKKLRLSNFSHVRDLALIFYLIPLDNFIIMV